MLEFGEVGKKSWNESRGQSWSKGWRWKSSKLGVGMDLVCEEKEELELQTQTVEEEVVNCLHRRCLPLLL